MQMRKSLTGVKRELCRRSHFKLELELAFAFALTPASEPTESEHAY